MNGEASKIIRIWCDNGANIHSRRFEDVRVSDMGYSDKDWEALDEQKQIAACEQWVREGGWVEIWFTGTDVHR